MPRAGFFQRTPGGIFVRSFGKARNLSLPCTGFQIVACFYPYSGWGLFDPNSINPLGPPNFIDVPHWPAGLFTTLTETWTWNGANTPGTDPSGSATIVSTLQPSFHPSGTDYVIVTGARPKNNALAGAGIVSTGVVNNQIITNFSTGGPGNDGTYGAGLSGTPGTYASAVASCMAILNGVPIPPVPANLIGTPDIGVMVLPDQIGRAHV